MEPDDARFLRRGLAALPVRASAGETCLDDNLLAGLVEGRLLPGEQALVEQHLADCAACRGLATELLHGSDLATRSAAPMRVGTRVIWGLAAAAAVGLAAWFWLRPAAPTIEVRLVASAERLRREAPGVLGDLAPLSAAELLRAEDAVVRAGPLRLLAPAETVLDRRPLLRFEAAPDAGPFKVSVHAVDGTTVFEQVTVERELPYPTAAADLAEGVDYEWRVAETRAPAHQERAFRVASAALRERIREGIRSIRVQAPAELAELLCAHFALRHGALAEAERWASAALTRAPGEPLARKTLYQTLVRMGSAAADRVLAEEDRR